MHQAGPRRQRPAGVCATVPMRYTGTARWACGRTTCGHVGFLFLAFLSVNARLCASKVMEQRCLPPCHHMLVPCPCYAVPLPHGAWLIRLDFPDAKNNDIRKQSVQSQCQGCCSLLAALCSVVLAWIAMASLCGVKNKLEWISVKKSILNQ